LNIPDAPRENALSQLSSALVQFNPALSSAVVQHSESIKVKDAAQAQADWNKVHKDYAEAVESGVIPAGASRAYVEAYKSTELNTKQLMFGNSLHKAYDESGLKDSDDPATMKQFIEKQTQEFRKAALMRDNTDRYTPLEIANSKFDEGLQGHINSLTAQHIQYRADERTKLGKETAQTNAGLHIDKLYDPTDPTSHIASANAIMETFFHPMRGVAANGVTKSEANKLMVDTIATKMVESGDEGMAQIAKYIGTSQGNNLGGTVYAKNKFKEAADAIMTNKIRNSNWNWQERERRTLEEGGLGPEAQAQVKMEEEKRRTELWARADRAAGHAERMANRTEVNADTSLKTDSHVSVILTGLEAKDMTNPRVKVSFDWLKFNAPDKWMIMSNYVNTFKKEKAAYQDNPSSELASARLRYEMSRNPLGFDASRIMASANNGTINPNKVQPLMDDWDKARTHQDNPFLQNPGFTKLIEDLRRVAVKDMSDQYGPGAINAMKVEQQMRTNAYEWIEANPKGTYLDFIKEMKTQAEPLAQDFSPEFAKDEARKLTPKPVPQKDTRSFTEKVLPNAMGGKPKPAPVTPAQTGPPPMKPSEAFNAMKPEAFNAIKKMMQDPQTDDMELEAAIYNSGLWAFMKSNGRTPAEFKQLKDDLVKLRKK
jgi:hypothetical protein